MNKFFKCIVFGLSLLVSGVAVAKDKIYTVDGYKVNVTDTGAGMFGIGASEPKSNMEFSDKLCVWVWRDYNIHVKMPNAEKIAVEEFRKYGFNISDNDKCDSLIKITTNGALDMGRADSMAQHSALPTSSRAREITGSLIAGAQGGGVNGIAAAAIMNVASFFGASTRLQISGELIKKPTMDYNEDGTFKRFHWKDINTNIENIYYKLEKGHEAPDDIVLRVAVDEWIEQYLIPPHAKDQASAASNPVVAPVSSVSAAKTLQ